MVCRPTLVEQTGRPEKIIEVQPVIHREVDQTEIRHVERHSYETVPSTSPAMINLTPIVQETIHPHIIEGLLIKKFLADNVKRLTTLLQRFSL
jgi:hypothetical protein